jgi:hypothetical protein
MARRLGPERLACWSPVPVFGASFHGEALMPQDAVPDHDQRLKVLLKEFFEAFFTCFYPDWAERFEFTDIEWLDKELFLAPPQGDKRQLDLDVRFVNCPPDLRGLDKLGGFCDGMDPVSEIRSRSRHQGCHPCLSPSRRRSPSRTPNTPSSKD